MDLLKVKGFTLRSKHITVTDADNTVTNVTIKDAPFEMKDVCITSLLSEYGDIIPNSMQRGKIKNSTVETGIRYLKMLNVENPIPEELEIHSKNIL